MFDIEKELKKYNLSTEDYENLLKDCSDKLNHINDLDWSEICQKYHLNFNGDTLRKACQPPLFGSIFVSEYFNWKSFDNNDVYINSIKEKIQELERAKVKARDERTELLRVIREEARKESYKDQILRCIKEYVHSPIEFSPTLKQMASSSDNDLIISCTDIHAGIEIDNYFNQFNENVLKDRFEQYLQKIFDVQQTHHSENAYVILSELVSGIIHNELRIENNKNLIEQFLLVINCISDFLTALSYKFNSVSVFVAPGNHSRISPKKEDSLKGENIDHFAIPYLQAKLQNFKNIYLFENDIEESVSIFEVRDNLIMCSHGDKDSPKDVVQKFSLFFGAIPDIIYLGHRHKNGMTKIYNTTVIESGTMSGTDNYALDSRLNTAPSQTISVINKNGLDCLYDVKFE